MCLTPLLWEFSDAEHRGRVGISLPQRDKARQVPRALCIPLSLPCIMWLSTGWMIIEYVESALENAFSLCRSALFRISAAPQEFLKVWKEGFDMLKTLISMGLTLGWVKTLRKLAESHSEVKWSPLMLLRMSTGCCAPGSAS